MTRLLAQTRWELRGLLGNGEQLLLAFAIPLGLLVLVRDLIPVLATAVLATMFTSPAIATGFERRSGALRFLGVTPLTRRELVTAKVLASLCVLVMSAALVTILAAVLHCLPAWSAGQTAIACAVIAVACVASTAWALFLAGTLRAEAVLALANAVFLAMLAAGLALPGHLSAPWSVLVQVIPSVALTQGLRDPSLLNVGLLGAWAVVGLVLAQRFFRWDD